MGSIQLKTFSQLITSILLEYKFGRLLTYVKVLKVIAFKVIYIL